ncbi:MAG: primase C-terminal domain-containing protein [Peptostreptococcaceae bacterium]|nr:primase C-terminal domain-containing protein [Peptostreptococcaceae bacterium]
MKYDNIPGELKKLNQWVCANSDSKVPMRALENVAASSTNPLTWSTFEDAYLSYESGNYDYLGFVFNDNHIVGIDIDTGFDEDGFINKLSADIINKCKSYTEKSRSGRGFHILIKGDLPFKGRNNLKGIEIYKQSRYFILTGDTILFQDIIENQQAIDYVVDTYFPETRNESKERKYADKIYSPVWGNPIVDGKVKLKPNYPKIPKGNRNISLTSLAGALHSLGYTKKHIFNELMYVNKVACDRPLSTYEVQTICNSVTKYRR